MTVLRYGVSSLIAVAVGYAVGIAAGTVFEQKFGLVWPVRDLVTLAVVMTTLGALASGLVVQLEEELTWESHMPCSVMS